MSEFALGLYLMPSRVLEKDFKDDFLERKSNN